MKSKISSIHKKYSQKKNMEEKIASAISAVKQILAMENVLENHKSEMLSGMIWKVSEANGKWNTRYFSAGVLSDEDIKLQHEHVITREFIINQLLKNPKEYQSILKQVTACVVTADEHGKLDKSGFGWERYKKAGIKV